MLPVEIFYAKIPNLAQSRAAKENPQLAVFISAKPKWQAKQTEKKALLFTILPLSPAFPFSERIVINT